MGKENAAEYFLSERNTKEIRSVSNCVNSSHPCTVELDENSQLSVMMPAVVSVTDSFDVTAKIEGVKVEQVTIKFKGVTHSMACSHKQ